MLEKDEGDDFIFDIVEEICDNAMKVIYDNYIQRQLLPFTISQARDAILQIIQVIIALNNLCVVEQKIRFWISLRDLQCISCCPTDWLIFLNILVVIFYK